MIHIENKLEITIHGSDAIHRKVETENEKTFVEVPKEWSGGKVDVVLYVYAHFFTEMRGRLC